MTALEVMGRPDRWWLDEIWKLTDYDRGSDALRVLGQFKDEILKEAVLAAEAVADEYANLTTQDEHRAARACAARIEQLRAVN